MFHPFSAPGGAAAVNLPVLVIGVGNADRGDDAVGLHVARALTARRLPGVVVTEAGGDALGLLDVWQGAAGVVLIDAAAPDGAPGRIHRLEATTEALPRELRLGSSHAFGLAEAVELARGLKRLPPWLVVYAIEADDCCIGAPLSHAVAAAVAPVVAQVEAELIRQGVAADA